MCGVCGGRSGGVYLGEEEVMGFGWVYGMSGCVYMGAGACVEGVQVYELVGDT